MITDHTYMLNPLMLQAYCLCTEKDLHKYYTMLTATISLNNGLLHNFNFFVRTSLLFPSLSTMDTVLL